MKMIMMDDKESNRGGEWRLWGLKERQGWDCDCRTTRGGTS